MFIKLSVIFYILHITVAQKENHDWDLAVVTNEEIELLKSDGSLIGTTFKQFNELKALAFDNVRHQFVVSDMGQENDTIFTVQLTKETEITPIIEDLPDDVQGLAIDPINDILYWTDSIERTINYLHLNDSTYQSKIFFAFTDQKPQDIAIDVCRRFIYWSNSDMNNPTIERAKLDGSQHEVLVHSNLHRPAGISIDYQLQRLFWADLQAGIYYTIESTSLEGKEREVVYRGSYATPFGLAVDSKAIYWTDINDNKLWKFAKADKTVMPIRDFKRRRPMGIVAKNIQITSFPDCEALSKAVASYTEPIEEVFEPASDDDEIEPMRCLNDGELIDNKFCRCPRGYTGKSCELSLCYNYCVHGDCYTSTLGIPQCHCFEGFGGKRCERNVCDGFCLNGGTCSNTGSSQSPPFCNCPENFTGARCESSLDVCDVFCQRNRNDVLISEQGEVICRCVDGTAEIIKSNYSSQALVSKQEHPLFFNHFQDTAFLAMTCLLFIMLIMIIILAVYTCSKHRRPRIKKRIIVNKNITPLTYRPQPTTEQCEITIENCCNMNICETPCFEPPQLPCLQNKNDDKKKLLSNMENGEDLY